MVSAKRCVTIAFNSNYRECLLDAKRLSDNFDPDEEPLFKTVPHDNTAADRRRGGVEGSGRGCDDDDDEGSAHRELQAHLRRCLVIPDAELRRVGWVKLYDPLATTQLQHVFWCNKYAAA